MTWVRIIKKEFNLNKRPLTSCNFKLVSCDNAELERAALHALPFVNIVLREFRVDMVGCMAFSMVAGHGPMSHTFERFMREATEDGEGWQVGHS